MPEALEPALSLSEVVLLLVALGLLLAGLVRLRRAVGVSHRENWLAQPRVMALAETVVWVTLAVVVGHWLLDGGGTWELMAGAAATVLVGAGLVLPVRDYVAGLVLRTTDAFRVGDQVRTEGVEGRVSSLQRRGVLVETPEGQLASVPWSRLAGASAVRGEGGAEAQHRFEVQLSPSSDPVVALALARDAALLTHEAHPARPPQVRSLGEDRLEVTVTTLVPGGAARIERAVRTALGA